MSALGATHEKVAKTRQQTASISGRLQQVLNKVVDLESLQVDSKDRKAWCITLKAVCLALDGCLFDAVFLSAISALVQLELPGLHGVGEAVAMEEGEGGLEGRLRLHYIPIPITLVLYKDYILVDPTSEEESVATASVSMVFDPSGASVSLEVASAGQHTTLNMEMLQKCILLGQKKNAERLSAFQVTNS